jgi:4-alpha-glucanotransferase
MSVPPFRPEYRAFELFKQAHADWLDDYALFRALKARYGGASYLQWPEDLVRRTPAALEQARRDLASQVEEVRFAQFLLSVQGARLKAHARAKGVRLIGDLPFFVSPDSSDVWANPELFLLDAHYRARVVAGVPPDYFSSQGQRWGNPIYDWDALAARGYRWCINRVRALLAHVDAIRLDHFRGFAAAWHIPSGAPDAQTGQWMPGPGATTEKTNGRSQSTDTAASAAGQQIHEHQTVAVRAAAAVQTRPATTAATEEVKRDRN